ncbi:MAG: recombinase family protein [Bacteroidales bacterium]
MIYLYLRISSIDQNEARQRIALQEYGGVFLVDKCSGAIPFSERENGSKIIQDVEKGLVKKIVVLDIDRLGRDCLDALQTLKFFKDKNVIVRVHRYGIENLINGQSNPTFELITNIMATLSQQEKERTKERQLEGIQNAKNLGVYKGRVVGSKNKDSISLIKKYPNVITCLKNNMSLNQIVVATGVSKSTVIRIKKEYLQNS